MIFLIFLLFASAEHDCYRVHRDLILEICIRPADTDSNNILNATEIVNFLNLHPVENISAEFIFFTFNKTEFDMTDWNSLNDVDILNICFVCQYSWNMLH